MSTKLGMNTSIAESVATTVSSLGTGLDAIDQEVRLARLMSLNPLNYMLNPGALVLTPVSIGIAMSASADITNARAQLEYLVEKLRQEATQQFQVSNSLVSTDPGWFAPGPNAQKPKDVGPFDEAIDLFGPFAKISDIVGIIGGAFEAVDLWWKGLPPGVTKVIKTVTKVGKFIPFVGIAFSLGSTILDWDNDNVWGNVRNIIGVGLDAASIVAAVTLIPPLTPAGVVIEGALLGVGLAWDVMDFAWDAHDDGDWKFPWE